MPKDAISQMDEILKSLQVLMEREEMLEKDKLLAEAEEVRQRIFALIEAVIPISQTLRSRGLMKAEFQARVDALLDRQKTRFQNREEAILKIQAQLTELKTQGANLKVIKPAYGKVPGARSSNLEMKG